MYVRVFSNTLSRLCHSSVLHWHVEGMGQQLERLWVGLCSCLCCLNHIRRLQLKYNLYDWLDEVIISHAFVRIAPYLFFDRNEHKASTVHSHYTVFFNKLSIVQMTKCLSENCDLGHLYSACHYKDYLCKRDLQTCLTVAFARGLSRPVKTF